MIIVIISKKNIQSFFLSLKMYSTFLRTLFNLLFLLHPVLRRPQAHKLILIQFNPNDRYTRVARSKNEKISNCARKASKNSILKMELSPNLQIVLKNYHENKSYKMFNSTFSMANGNREIIVRFYWWRTNQLSKRGAHMLTARGFVSWPFKPSDFRPKGHNLSVHSLSYTKSLDLKTKLGRGLLIFYIKTHTANVLLLIF